MHENKVITDNLTLEIVGALLERNKSRSYSGYDQYNFGSYSGYNQNNSSGIEDITRRSYTYGYTKGNDTNDIGTLLRLLDLLVLYDGLVIDNEKSFLWEKFSSMQVITPMISKIRIGDNTKNKITSEAASTFGYVNSKNTTSLVAEGALYYLGLANMLGIDYWASPERSEFISGNLCYQNPSAPKSFIKILDKFMDEKLKSLSTELLQDKSVSELQSQLYFPGFGASILANCKHREEILPKTIEFRQSSECQGFREWLINMDNATEEGNLIVISNNMRELQKVTSEVHKSLVGSLSLENIELEIGLSPSIKLSAETINLAFQGFRPKKLHLSFLRKHFYRALSNTNLNFHVRRLFFN